MFKTLKYIILFLFGGPILYILIALGLSYVPVNGAQQQSIVDTIYVHSNGVHLDLLLPNKAINPALKSGIALAETSPFLSFGWGDENFYLNTPNWSDLTASTTLQAMFLESSTLMHLTPYQSLRKSFLAIPVDSFQLAQINSYLMEAFALDEANQKQQLLAASYGYGDEFYRANGSYSCLKTCNSWVNIALKKADLEACLWTPFDFPVLQRYD